MNVAAGPARVAIVTGGGGALGSAIARALHREGCHVVLADLDTETGEKRAAEIAASAGPDGPTAVAVRVDMAEPASVRDLANRVGGMFDRIDVVVNNAAVQRRGGIADFDVDDWDLAHRVNLRGPALLCQAVLPWWKRQNAGSVVNIASRVWLTGGEPIYVSAKAGVVGLTRSLATELGPLGVTANAVAPSFVATGFTRAGQTEAEWNAMIERNGAMSPLGRVVEPVDIAEAVAFLASPRARAITGEILHVCAGTQLAPRP